LRLSGAKRCKFCSYSRKL